MLLIDNFTLDITRNCNFRCEHCGKGEACNENIDMNILPKIFNKDTIIAQLQFSGGEVFLNPKLLDKIIDFIINSGCNIRSLDIVTNGTCYTEEIYKILIKMYNYIASCHFNGYYQKPNELVSLELSTDEFHKKEIDKVKEKNFLLYKQYMENIKRLMNSKFFYSFRENDAIIRSGRAKNLNIKTYEPLIMDIIYAKEDDFNRIWHIDMDIYGNVRNVGDMEGPTLGNILSNDLLQILESNGFRCKNSKEVEKYALKMINNIKKINTDAIRDKK